MNKQTYTTVHITSVSETKNFPYFQGRMGQEIRRDTDTNNHNHSNNTAITLFFTQKVLQSLLPDPLIHVSQVHASFFYVCT